MGSKNWNAAECDGNRNFQKFTDNDVLNYKLQFVSLPRLLVQEVQIANKLSLRGQM